ncbi:MAG: UDP-N-acetylmuramoyl-L-alanyl-D-glutamate--2,6-diaminopimelate ligase [Rhodococcus sp. (in: high G+C Gram-positive bacteria)]
MTCDSVPSAPDDGCPARSGPCTLGNLAALLEVPTPMGEHTVIDGVADNSRTVQPGDLYLAFPGKRVHGLDFEEQARSRGAIAALSDRPGLHLPTLVVEDPRAWAGPVSAHVYGHPSEALDLIGVTGTNGKTSTAYLLGAALTAAGETVGSITGISITGPRGSTPTSRTTPEAAPLQRSLDRFRREGVTAAAMEVSSHAVVQGRVDGTRFAAMGFTNLGQDHLDYHGSMEHYFAAKSQLFEPERAAVAAAGIDDDYGRRLAATVRIPCWTWSAHDHRADIYGDCVETTGVGTSFVARTPTGDYKIQLPLLGPHQAHNALAAFALIAATGRDLDAAVAGFESITTVPGRLERIEEGQQFLALVDYMHNTAGQRRLLPYIRSLTNGKIIAVVGATGDRDPGKRFPLGATAAALTDVVIVSDESPFSEDASAIREAVAAGATAAAAATVVIEPDRRRAFELAVACADPGDIVLVTGRGCDDEQVFGDDVVQFDDRVELRKALRQHVYGTDATS